VVIPKGCAPSFLTTQQVEQLKELSKQLNTMIENRLTYPFDYERHSATTSDYPAIGQ
jgi:hypothetical protein